MQLGIKGRELKVAVLGLGSRGLPQLKLLLTMDDLVIAAVCDAYADRAAHAAQVVEEKRGYTPLTTTSWQEVLDQPDIEALFIFTDWQSHIPLALAAMDAGKIPGLEVGGANTVEECWQLVWKSEQTGVPLMLLENCCYGREEMALLRMVREGLFGELVHCRGGYEHDLRDEIGRGDIDRHYRQMQFMHRNAELYPTHELGPIAKYLNLNRGNRMMTLSAVASKAAGQQAWLRENRPDSPLLQRPFRQGDIVTTTITCANGETILLTHDCTLPRAYSRGGRVQGTKGIWLEDNRSIFIDGRSPHDPSHWTHRWESDAAYMEEFCHPLWRAYEEFGLRGGHGGMDYLVLRAFVESIQKQEPFPIDVYDCASWMAITALSEQSVAMAGHPVPVPDFTSGRWFLPREKNEGMYALD